MLTVERPVPPNQIKQGEYAEIIGLYSGSQDNPRKLPIEGTRDVRACRNPTLEVIFYDEDNNVIDPSPTVIRIRVTEGEYFWEESIEAPEKAVMCDIKLYCGADLQDSREKIGFASAQRLMSAKSAGIFEVEKSGNNAILMTINNPAAVDPHDSDSIHVIRYISHGVKTSFSPHCTTNPGSSTRLITYYQLGPGRYFARLVYVPVNGPAETYTDSTVKID